MNKVLYKLTGSKTVVCEDAVVQSYGISCFENGKKTLSFPDILPDREKVSHLVHLCNSLHVAPCQLEDIIEDFLP